MSNKSKKVWLKRTATFTYGAYEGKQQPLDRVEGERPSLYLCAGFVHRVLGVKLEIGECRMIAVQPAVIQE